MKSVWNFAAHAKQEVAQLLLVVGGGVLASGRLVVRVLLVGGVLFRGVVISLLAINMIESPEFPCVELAKTLITRCLSCSENYLPPDPKSESQGCGTKA